MPSPSTPSQFCEAVPTQQSDLCVKVSKFFGIAQLLCDFFSWFIDSDGAISSAAKTEIASFIIPPGFIMYSASADGGDGWLLANGQAVSRTTYAALFSAIGTRYGDGDGSTTFNLPDLQGRSPIGAGSGTGLTFRDINSPHVGEETHLQTIAEMPSHAHDPRAPMTEIFGRVAAGGLNTSLGAGAQYRADAIGDTGGGQPFNVVHPSTVLFPFVKT
jgi:Microcystin-dependent protein